VSVRDVAIQYFSCVHAHDADGLSRLFAEDGWVRPPPPIKEQRQGRPAIREFYAELFASVPDLRIDPDYQLIVDGDVCVARFSSWTHGRHNQGVIDIFTVNERDELVEMVAYSRLSVEDS
jgi:ketosteroid isomerase-like protein